MSIIKRTAILLIAAVLSTIIFSCTTTEAGKAGARSGRPVYYGYGEGSSALEAMRNARMFAVKQTAADLLETAAYEAQKQELDDLLTDITDFSPYIYKDSQQTISSGQSAGFSYQIGVRMNLESIADLLISRDIFGGQVDGTSGKVYVLNDQKAPQVKADAAAGSAEENTPSSGNSASGTSSPETVPSEVSVTPYELAVIKEYLSEMTYMVYFNDETESDPYLARAAVASANRYLEQQGIEYIDLNQIERIKSDQRLVYEEETGEAVSVIQWIAHKLNADIYIEVALDTSSSTKDGKYYGTASVTLNCFDASTAIGRGSAVYQTNPPAFSTVSESDALNNAVTSAAFKGMSAAVASAEEETLKALSSGFKYTLYVVNTPDSGVMRDFSKKVEKKVKNIKRLSYSPEETIYEVSLIGDIGILEDLIYDIAELIPGLENLTLVMQRRNSITFDTGM